MKTKVLFWISLLFLLTIIVSCSKGDGPLEIKPPVVVEADAYASAISIPYAGATTLFWTSRNVTKVTMNDIQMSLIGSQKIDSLIADTAIRFKFWGVDGSMINKLIVIAVAPKPIVVIPTKLDSMTNDLCSGLWRVVRIEQQLRGSWYDMVPDQNTLSERELFTKDGKFQITFTNDPSFLAKSLWSFSQDLKVLNYGGRTDTIVSLSSEKTILSAWAEDPITKMKVYKVKTTYIH